MTFANFLWAPDVQTFLLQWLPIVFMGLLVVAVFALIRYMPRTKPVQIKPEASPSIGWSDIAGSDEAKEELREIVDYLRDPRRFREMGAKVPKGVLLHGPPGTGKTLLAKAVAHESGARFYSQSAASFVEMFAGLGAARIRRLFKIARQHAPAIVFIDELDAVGGHRGMDISGERDQTLNQLLVEMDGFSARKDVVVIAASNLLEKLDPALLRPGRFDRQIFVSPPDVARPRADPPGPFAQQAAVRGRRSEAGRAADGGADGRRPREHLQRGGDLRRPALRAERGDGGLRLLTRARRRRDAVAPRADRPREARRRLPRGRPRRCAASCCRRSTGSTGSRSCPHGRALGYTLNLPEEDRYLKTREELIDFMTMLLGGRAAEQLVFGSITTGASDDLKRVAEIAHAMIHDYAMGTGITSLRVAADGPASEASRRVRDEEVRDLADEAFRTATSILDSHRAQLDQLAARLLANEVLERGDIDEIMEGVPSVAPPPDRTRRDRARGSHRREAGGALAEALSAQFPRHFVHGFAPSLRRVEVRKLNISAAPDWAGARPVINAPAKSHQGTCNSGSPLPPTLDAYPRRTAALARLRLRADAGRPGQRQDTPPGPRPPRRPHPCRHVGIR